MAFYVKKAHKPLQLAIEYVVELVCDSPDIGELKVGDLAGMRKITERKRPGAINRPAPRSLNP